MSAKRKAAKRKAAKRTCDVKTHFCSGEGVHRVEGTKAGDPVFDVCLACRAILSRQSVKVRESAKVRST